jgi:hypothetical protein
MAIIQLAPRPAAAAPSRAASGATRSPRAAASAIKLLEQRRIPDQPPRTHEKECCDLRSRRLAARGLSGAAREPGEWVSVAAATFRVARQQRVLLSLCSNAGLPCGGGRFKPLGNPDGYSMPCEASEAEAVAAAAAAPPPPLPRTKREKRHEKTSCQAQAAQAATAAPKGLAPAALMLCCHCMG